MKYTLLEEAITDISEIELYIRERNPSASKKVIGEFKNSFNLIADFPNIGVKFPADDEILIYHVPKIPYSIPYMVYNGYIVIMRVFHQSQAKMFDDDKPSNKVKSDSRFMD